MGGAVQQQEPMQQQMVQQVEPSTFQRSGGVTTIETPMGTLSFSDWTGVAGIVVIIIVAAVMKKYISGPYSIIAAIFKLKQPGAQNTGDGTGDGNKKDDTGKRSSENAEKPKSDS